MFERFTDRARRVLVLAQEEARLLDHHFIGTEHLLLGLIKEGDGLGAQALTSLGVSLGAAREKVTERIGRPSSTHEGSQPFTPRAKQLFELSMREALRLGHKGVDTEHLLLGLTHQDESGAAEVLVALGVDLHEARVRLPSLMSQPGYQPSDKGVASPFAEGEGLVAVRGFSSASLSRRAGGIGRLRAVVPILYGFVVGLIDPAQHYMLRASGHNRRRRRRAPSYSPLTIGPRHWRDRQDLGATAPPAEVEEGVRRRAHDRDARVKSVMETFGPLLDAGVQELLARHETVMVTPSAELTARIVRFRSGDSVLHVRSRRETRTEDEKAIQMMQGTETVRVIRLPRTGVSAETLTRHLASELAEGVES